MNTPTPVVTPTPDSSKKSHGCLLVFVILSIPLFILAIISFLSYKAITDSANEYADNANRDSSYNDDYTTNTSTASELWEVDAQLIDVPAYGYSFLIPKDWSLDSEDTWETGFSSDYVFFYYNELGKTTNHFVFRRSDYTLDNPDITLDEYSSNFTADLDEELTDGGYRIISTSNRIFGDFDYAAYVVILGNDESGKRSHYIMTVYNGVAYEFALFYFADQEEQALADFEKVIETVGLSYAG